MKLPENLAHTSQVSKNIRKQSKIVVVFQNSWRRLSTIETEVTQICLTFTEAKYKTFKTTAKTKVNVECSLFFTVYV